MEKEKLDSTTVDLEEDVTLLKSKLDNMTKFVCMLSNDFNMLDEILEVWKKYMNMKSTGFNYDSRKKKVKIPTNKVVFPEKKTEFLMKDHMS